MKIGECYVKANQVKAKILDLIDKEIECCQLIIGDSPNDDMTARFILESRILELTKYSIIHGTQYPWFDERLLEKVSHEK